MLFTVHPKNDVIQVFFFCTHSNTPVARGESRLSFAQYCAGRIFQFIDNGFRTEKVLKQEDYPAFKQQQAEKPTRWSKCISLLSTLEELDIQKQIDDIV